jgi:hypothetical protein
LQSPPWKNTITTGLLLKLTAAYMKQNMQGETSRFANSYSLSFVENQTPSVFQQNISISRPPKLAVFLFLTNLEDNRILCLVITKHSKGDI